MGSDWTVINPLPGVEYHRRDDHHVWILPIGEQTASVIVDGDTVDLVMPATVSRLTDQEARQLQYCLGRAARVARIVLARGEE